MFRKLRHQLPHYFSRHPSRGLTELYWSVGLMGLGTAMVTIFEPIFLYSLGYRLDQIALFYVMVYGIYLFILPIFGRLVGKIGLEKSIFISQFFLIGYYISLFAISRAGCFFFIAPVFFALQKSFYWPAYHADFAIFSRGQQRGREVSGVETLNMVIYVVGPLVGGIILEWSTFSLLFIAAAAMFLLAGIPLTRIKEIHPRLNFSYADVFRELVDKEHRRKFLSYLGFGEELIVLTIWPIFIYTVIKDYLEIGGIIAFSTLITGITVLYIGKLADRYQKNKILKIGSFFYFASYLVRGLASKAWHVFGLDVFSRVSKEMIFIPLGAMSYDAARRLGPLAYGVFIEQSVAITKFLAGLLVILIVLIFPSPWLPIFILAGLFSLLYNFYKD